MKKKKESTIKPCGCSDDRPPHICKICFKPVVKENKIKIDIIKYLEKLPHCQVTEIETSGRRVSKGYAKPKESEGVGRADLFICYYGFYIELETKKPKGRKRKSQIERVPKIKKALGQYWFAESLEEVVELIENFKIEKSIKPKTDWLPISEMKIIQKEYWIVDKDNNTGVGFLINEHQINFNIDETPVYFGTPVMFAEIKPPAIL